MAVLGIFRDAAGENGDGSGPKSLMATGVSCRFVSVCSAQASFHAPFQCTVGGGFVMIFGEV